ncbi:MAG: HAMP domain-containing histidine kinase [Spirochaetales bacterium]|nr:MAG: HAMP domain-containing histidine kinase [Spirochaetales bacterium]
MHFDYDATDTDFLPAPRYHPDEIEIQCADLFSIPLTTGILDLPFILFVVNDKRQIIWLNHKAAESIRLEHAIGLRPGEALGCIHSSENAGGCGTTRFCQYCGTPAAIMKALAGTEDMEECVIQLNEGYDLDALDLLVWAKPLKAGAGNYILFVAQDVSDQKRHEVLERIFYHDIGNTIAGIRSMLELITVAKDDVGVDYLRYLRSAADQLVEEIDSQRALKEAEAGTLAAEPIQVDLSDTIERAVRLFDYSAVSRDIRVEAYNHCENCIVVCDPALVCRIAVNMLKNAFEASERNRTIRIGCDDSGTSVSIWVWNPAVLSQEARLRMFQRSFSTKGKGRGLGTYGMKILAERYLNGSVSFTSEPETGTTFRLTLPKWHNPS